MASRARVRQQTAFGLLERLQETIESDLRLLGDSRLDARALGQREALQHVLLLIAALKREVLTASLEKTG
jgi:hypothetical protein